MYFSSPSTFIFIIAAGEAVSAVAVDEASSAAADADVQTDEVFEEACEDVAPVTLATAKVTQDDTNTEHVNDFQVGYSLEEF